MKNNQTGEKYASEVMKLGRELTVRKQYDLAGRMKLQEECNLSKNEERILNQQDLYEVLPFKRTKIQQLLRANKLPVTKVGRDYITTMSLLNKWIEKHIGEEIYY